MEEMSKTFRRKCHPQIPACCSQCHELKHPPSTSKYKIWTSFGLSILCNQHKFYIKLINSQNCQRNIKFIQEVQKMDFCCLSKIQKNKIIFLVFPHYCLQGLYYVKNCSLIFNYQVEFSSSSNVALLLLQQHHKSMISLSIQSNRRQRMEQSVQDMRIR